MQEQHGRTCRCATGPGLNTFNAIAPTEQVKLLNRNPDKRVSSLASCTSSGEGTHLEWERGLASALAEHEWEVRAPHIGPDLQANRLRVKGRTYGS